MTEPHSGGEFFPQWLQPPSPPNAESREEQAAAPAPFFPAQVLQYLCHSKRNPQIRGVQPSAILPWAWQLLLSLLSMQLLLLCSNKMGGNSLRKRKTKGKTLTPNFMFLVKMNMYDLRNLSHLKAKSRSNHGHVGRRLPLSASDYLCGFTFSFLWN